MIKKEVSVLLYELGKGMNANTDGFYLSAVFNTLNTPLSDNKRSAQNDGYYQYYIHAFHNIGN